MNDNYKHKCELEQKGFTVIENVFPDNEIDAVVAAIKTADNSHPTFRKSKDLFAIRQFLKEVPEVRKIISVKLKELVAELFGADYFIVKSIYFDKPKSSNWFVAWHQDLTISAKNKVLAEGFGPWTIKQNQYAVQPPIAILENIFTIRIHLDETNERNGALKVIPSSHIKGLQPPQNIDYSNIEVISCAVPRGGVMIMKPLLLHASERSTNLSQRRVIHIEFSNQQVPEEIGWGEYMVLA